MGHWNFFGHPIWMKLLNSKILKFLWLKVSRTLTFQLKSTFFLSPAGGVCQDQCIPDGKGPVCSSKGVWFRDNCAFACHPENVANALGNITSNCPTFLGKEQGYIMGVPKTFQCPIKSPQKSCGAVSKYGVLFRSSKMLLWDRETLFWGGHPICGNIS